MDVSDGFVGDLSKMLRGERRHRRDRPRRVCRYRRPRARRSRLDPDLFAIAATGGDDYELLASVAPEVAAEFEAAARAAGVAVTAVGFATAGGAAPRFILAGRELSFRTRLVQPLLKGFRLSFDPHALDLRFEAAKALAHEAGDLARRRFLDRTSFTVGFKGPQDYLTEVDGEVEKLIAGRLGTLFPGDGFIGEEGAAREAMDGHPIWVVDPIDGTANFATGVPHFCVSIAAVVGREIEIGVIYAPMVDELFAARRGAGASLNGVAMKASPAKELAVASVEIGYNRRTTLEKYLGLLARVGATGASVLRCGSGALGLAYVAAGRRDAYAENFINSWDCLAAIAMVKEAGGYASDFLANDGLTAGNPLIVAAPGLRDEFLAAAAVEGLVP